MCKGKMIKLAVWLNNEGSGSLTVEGIAHYSKLGMRRTKQLLKGLKANKPSVIAKIPKGGLSDSFDDYLSKKDNSNGVLTPQ